MLIKRGGAATARVGFNASCISPDGSQLDLIVDDGLSASLVRTRIRGFDVQGARLYQAIISSRRQRAARSMMSG
jgi:hypothetical protein